MKILGSSDISAKCAVIYDQTKFVFLCTQHNFVKSGGVSVVLGMLVKNNFLPNADTVTKR